MPRGRDKSVPTSEISSFICQTAALCSYRRNVKRYLYAALVVVAGLLSLAGALGVLLLVLSLDLLALSLPSLAGFVSVLLLLSPLVAGSSLALDAILALSRWSVL